jgi:hypothetical protein
VSGPTFVLVSEDGERYTFMLCPDCGALVSYYTSHACPAGVTP